MDDENLQSLLGILGHSLSTEEGAALLQQSGGSVEAAINQHFASLVSPPPVEPPSSPRSHLRSIVGNNIPDEDLLALLNQSDQSVEQAANLFFNAAADKEAGAAADGATAASAALRQQQDAPPVAGNSGQNGVEGRRVTAGERATSREDSASAAAGPSRQHATGRGRGRPRRRVDTFSPARLAALASGEGPASRVASGQRRRQVRARTPVEDTESDSTSSGDDEEEEDPEEPAGPRRSMRNRRAPDSDDDFEVMVDSDGDLVAAEPAVLANDSATAEESSPSRRVGEAGAATERGELVPRRRRSQVKSKAIPSSAASGADQPEAVCLPNWVLLNRSLLGPLKRATQPPLHLPLKKWRDKHGNLFAPDAKRAPTEEQADPERLKLPIILGSFDFELSKEASSGVQTGCEHTISFEQCNGRDRRFARLAVSVLQGKQGTKGCRKVEIGSVGAPFSDLVQALHDVEASGLATLQTAVHLKHPGKSGVGKVSLKVTVGLTEEALNLSDKGKTTAKMHYDSARRQLGQRFPEEMAKVVHYLLTNGSGLSLGPDCDNVLNFMGGDLPSAGTGPGQAGPSTASSSDMGDRPAAAEDESDISRLMNAGRLPIDALKAQQPKDVVTAVKPWQLQGLHWMLQREVSGDTIDRGQLKLHPCWLQLQTQDRQLIYVHRLLPHLISTTFLAAPIGSTCGGFLCDEMGLGKTLEVIMLVLQHKAPKGWAISDFSEAEGYEWQKGQKPELSLKTTLIVVPNNLRNQWADELKKHLKPGALTWCTYDGTGRTPSRGYSWYQTNADKSNIALTELWGKDGQGKKVALHTCDIALVTYEGLMREIVLNKRPPILQYGYWRLCLDEAQLVSKTNTQAAAAVSDLYRRHAWVVTGTPLSAKVEEIQGLIDFLDLDPFYLPRVWNALLWDKPLLSNSFDVLPPARGPYDPLLPLVSLLRGVMLRRTQEDLGPLLELPPCTKEDWVLELSHVEKAVYERSHKQMLSALEAYNHSKAAQDAGEPVDVRRYMMACRKLLTDLRIAAADPQLPRGEANLGGKRRSMNSIMIGLIMQAFHAYEVGLRSYLQAALLETLVTPTKWEFSSKKGRGPEEAAEERLLDLKSGLVRSIPTDPHILLGGRHSDGLLLEPEAHTATAFWAALQAIVPENDSQGKEVSWSTAFRIRKRKAQEAAGLRQPLEEAPDPRIRWAAEDAVGDRKEDNADLDDADDDDAEPSAGIANGSRGMEEGEPAAGIGRRTRRAAAREASLGPNGRPKKKAKKDMTKEEQTADAAAKKAAKKERAARKEAKKTRKELRDAEYAAWLSEQAPEPQLEADILEEELARQAHHRLRSWARLYLDAADAVAEHLRREGNRLARAAANRTGIDVEEILAQSEKAQKEAPAVEIERAGPSKHNPDEAGPSALGASGSAQQPAADVDARELFASAMVAAGLDLEIATDIASMHAFAQQVQREARQVREIIGAAEVDKPVGDEPRFSKRKREMEPEQELQMQDLNDLVRTHAEQQRASNTLLRELDTLRVKWNPQRPAAKAREAEKDKVRPLWSNTLRLAALQDEMLANAKGKRPAEATAEGAAIGMQQEDENTCPVCLDVALQRTVTSCGHYFCSACIHNLISPTERGQCPLCRKELKKGDLFDAFTAEEEKDADERKGGGFGTKVNAVVTEVLRMRKQRAGAKAVVFSMWSRLLNVVSLALDKSHVPHVNLATARSKDLRAAQLDVFIKDPSCSVLLVVLSTLGGAAGLTLTVADTAFLMEPSLSSGLEAQAAGRIHRLGQQRTTRVIRLVAQQTIDEPILGEQQRRMSSTTGSEGLVPDVDVSTLIHLLEKHPPPFQGVTEDVAVHDEDQVAP